MLQFLLANFLSEWSNYIKTKFNLCSKLSINACFSQRITEHLPKIIVTGDIGSDIFIYIDKLRTKAQSLREAWVRYYNLSTKTLPGMADAFVRYLNVYYNENYAYNPCKTLGEECSAREKNKLLQCKDIMCREGKPLPKSVYILTQQNKSYSNNPNKDREWRIEQFFLSGEIELTHCNNPLPIKEYDKYDETTPVLLVDYNQGWRKVIENKKLLEFLKDRDYIVRTHDPMLKEWQNLRRDLNKKNNKKIGIWFSQVKDMSNGDLWVSCVWEDVSKTIIEYLKQDDTLWDKLNNKWLHYIVILISAEGVLILCPDKTNEILLIVTKEQPGSFAMRGYGIVTGPNIVFICSLIKAILQPKQKKTLLENIVYFAKEGLYCTRKLIELGFVGYDKVAEYKTNLPYSEIKEFAKKLEENKYLDKDQDTQKQKTKQLNEDLKNAGKILTFAKQRRRNDLYDALKIVLQDNESFNNRVVLEIGQFITTSPDYARHFLRLARQLEVNILYEDRKIYSCAIFGEPGSGKSSIAEELLKAIQSKTDTNITNPISYNLSQFESTDNLIEAFKNIREHILKGNIPFVIWDEFDTHFQGKECGWLSSFLMPMQDSKFYDREMYKVLGKCIFIFIGGTFTKESDFIEWTSHKENKKLKGKDFHSRLDSSLTVPSIDVQINKENGIIDQKSEARTTRAVMIRKFLQKYKNVKYITIGVLIYVLHVKLQHGIRSLEKIIKNSELRDTTTFHIKHLPPSHTLKIHVVGGENVDNFLSEIKEIDTRCFETTFPLAWQDPSLQNITDKDIREIFQKW